MTHAALAASGGASQCGWRTCIRRDAGACKRAQRSLAWSLADPPGSACSQGRATIAAADAAVVADGLTRIFDDATAVADVSFEVPPGSIFGIIGPSGSGKTTTLRMVMGSIAPTKGSVRVLGDEPLRFRRQTRERIGYMPQQFVLYPDLTVSENVDFVGSLFGLFTWRRRGRVKDVLRLLDLWDVRKRRAKDLSGGMQRRLELACALVHEPRLLILDEPTAGLDPLLRLTVWKELHRIRNAGVTILVTTQYVGETEECDQVALISEGSLIALSDPNGLRRAAFGGDVVEITTKATFDASVLEKGPQVHEIRQTGLREIRATVDDAGEGLPELVDAINAAGGDVEAAREARPTFDEVFAELVERHRRELAQVPGEPRDPEPPVEQVSLPPAPDPNAGPLPGPPSVAADATSASEPEEVPHGAA